MSKKPASRLGRGLSSLLSVPSLEETGASDGSPLSTENRLAERDFAPSSADAAPGHPVAGPAVVDIHVADIAPNPHQPRRSFDEVSLNQLARSLRSTGLVQPIIVRPAAHGYELIAGERRLRAARLAGLSTIPALVREVESAQQAELALVENVQREDLNPIDRARAYRDLMAQLGITQLALAERLGEDRSTVANHLRLLDLAHGVQELIRDGKLSLGHAKLLAGLPDLLRQTQLAGRAAAEQLSVRQLETLLLTPPALPNRAGADHQAHLADLEKQIAQQLGLRVQVRRAGKGKGRLVIHYGSLDQFDELLSRLSIQVETT